jgi:O-antigen/teichoic acid export membrane protein
MRNINKRRIIQNVSSSWFSLGITVVVGILLSPYILHRLGDAAFGIWVLIFSITDYYGLFDLGIRSSVVRYVSKFAATDDHGELSKLINTSLFTYSCIGAASLLLTVVLAHYVDSLFHIPPEFYSTARVLLLIVGTSVALGFPLGIVGGVLEGLQRFYVVSWTNVASTVLRAVLIVYALRHGGGLLTVASITVVLPLLTGIVRAIITVRICPISFGWRYIDRSTFREIANYGGVTFMIIVAGRLKFKTDEIVIGSMLSAAAITYFNVGARIVDYAGEVVTSLAQNFLPMASESEAVGDIGLLRRVFVAGNRFCAFTIFPITAVLLILGKSVIEVWVGKRYVETSYPVLVIMIIASTLMWAQGASGRVLFGISKHGTWAIVTLVEGICNLILSIILVRPYGIVGDAFGTAIPLTCSMVFFMPAHLCKRLGISLRHYLREAYVLPLIAVAPLVVCLLLMKRWFVPHNYWQLGIHLLAGGIVYGAALWWAYKTNRVLRVGTLTDEQKAVLEPAAGSPVESFQQDI